MKIWKAHYKDKFHDVDTDIINTETDHNEPLSLVIDGIEFSGVSIGDLELKDANKYDEIKDKFCILRSGGYSVYGIDVSYCYELQRYSLDVDIPVTIVRRCDDSETEGIIHIYFEYKEQDKSKHRAKMYCGNELVYHDDAVVHEFSLHVDGKCFHSSRLTLDFESALTDICRQTAKEYRIKCCFTCQYSDYSPYGNDYFGSMLCYCDNKEDYLKVNNKGEFIEHLSDTPYKMRQETYLCGEYSVRDKCPGYRGYVSGANDT